MRYVIYVMLCWSYLLTFEQQVVLYHVARTQLPRIYVTANKMKRRTLLRVPNKTNERHNKRPQNLSRTTHTNNEKRTHLEVPHLHHLYYYAEQQLFSEKSTRPIE